jgi:two-component system, OmpR family, sensor histidine kinase KdpD
LSGLPRYPAAVVVDVAETLPLVLADPALLERAIANLVENALRHSPPGGKVRVEADRADDVVELRIVDRGPGIPERERERVFRPFQRLSDSGPEGTGLGLAIARGFIEAMGGTLTIDDTPGGGTTVAIRLRRRGG